MAVTRKFINKQQHNHTCGAVAVLNAMKWLGCKHTSYRANLPWFNQSHITQDRRGMWPNNISHALNLLGIDYKRKNFATIRDIEDALDDDKSVILLFRWYSSGEYGHHYTFIDRHTDKSFQAWNWKYGSEPWLSKKLLTQWFRCMHRWQKDNCPYFPVIWVVDRD